MDEREGGEGGKMMIQSLKRGRKAEGRITTVGEEIREKVEGNDGGR